MRVRIFPCQEGRYSGILLLFDLLVFVLTLLEIDKTEGGCEKSELPLPAFYLFDHIQNFPGQALPTLICCTAYPGEDFPRNFTPSLHRLLNPESQNVAKPSAETKVGVQHQTQEEEMANLYQTVEAKPRYVSYLKIDCPQSEDPCHIPGITETPDKSKILESNPLTLDRKLSIFLQNLWVNWTRLATLDLSKTRIAQLAPRAFQGLGSVKKLDLAWNRLSRIDHSLSFSGLLSLKTLNLMGNNLESFPLPILNIKSLQTLELSRNNITRLEIFGPSPVAPKLTKLWCQNCGIKEVRPNFFAFFPVLKKLDLSYNLLTFLHPKTFTAAKTPRLRQINLGHNQLTTVGLAHNFQNLPRLKWLNLPGNNLTEDFKISIQNGITLNIFVNK